MAPTDNEPLLQQRRTQLNDIVARRNECLRELFALMHWKPDSEQILVNFGPEDEGVKAFLQRFDIQDNLDQGSISHLDEDEVTHAFQTPLLALQQPPAWTADHGPKSTRATRSRARAEPVASTSGHKPPSSSGADKKRQQKASNIEEHDEDHDELDVIGSGPASDDESVRVRPTKTPSALQDSAAPVVLKKESTDTPVPQLPVVPSPTIKGNEESKPIAKDDKMDVDVLEEKEKNAEASTPIKTEAKKESTAMEVDEPTSQSQTTLPKPESVPATTHTSASTPAPAVIEQTTLPTTIAPSQLVSRAAINIPVPSTPTASSIPIPNGAALAPPRQFETSIEAQRRAWVPRVPFQPNYTLPPISVLPPEFTRKAKNNRKRRDRDKDKEKDKERVDSKQSKDDVLPLGINRWAATLVSNPVHKRLAKSQKCLSTRDWNIGIAELRFIRATDKIEALKQKAQWSMRQPKKQRGVGGLQKTHWDYLLDEMKWMRIDFREERRWKLAVAYSLSTRVLEWHAAKTPEERVRLGITVKWKFEPKEGADTNMEHQEADGDGEPEAEPEPEAEEKVGPSLVGVDYGSDDEDEDEQDKQQSPAENMDTSAVDDCLNTTQEMAMKNEEIDDDLALKALPPRDADQEMADGTNPPAEPSESVEPAGLKLNSNNPLLNSKSSSPNAEPEPPTAKVSSKSAFAPLRAKILHSADDELFFNFADESNDGHGRVEIPDLTSLFPDLPPYTLLDVASPTPPTEGKKKAEKRSDRDDPNKRVEDTTYTKVYPKGKFMFTKPTLLGPLQPVKRWKGGRWLPTEDSQVMSDMDPAPTRGQHHDEDKFDLFDGRSTTSGASSNFALQASKGSRKADHTWTPTDDGLLKSLIDKYSTNWNLVADCFNSARLTTPMDRRSAWDCYERWREKWGSERKPNLVDVVVNTAADDSAATTSGSVGVGVASASQMQTRKRMSSSAGTTSPVQPGVGVAGPGGVEKGGSLSSSEMKKRRRHLILADTIRRYHKKRADAAQKAAASARKSTGMHDSHQQFNKLPRYTPAELSRMKAERDAAEVARKRQEEQARLLLLQQQQQNRLGAVAGAAGQAAPATGGQTTQNTPPAVPSAPTSGGTPIPVQGGQAAPNPGPAGPTGAAVTGQAAALAQAGALTPQQQLMLQMAAQSRANPNLAAQVAAATRARMAASASTSGATAAVPRPGMAQAVRGLQMPNLGSASNGQAAGSAVANGGFYSLGSQEHQLLLQLALQQAQAQAAQQQAQQAQAQAAAQAQLQNGGGGQGQAGGVNSES